MSALQGFTNVLGRASDMSYRRDQAQNRRDQLDLYERNLELAEEKQAQENLQYNANNDYKYARQKGYIAKDGVGLGDGLKDALIAGDEEAKRFTIGQLNRAGIVEGGGKITSLTRDEKRGGFYAAVENTDGSPGAITVGGSNAPNADMVFIPDNEITREANAVWDLTVMPYQSEIRVSELRSLQGVIEADSNAIDARNADASAQSILAAQRYNKGIALLSIPAGAARREVMGMINDPNVTPSQQAEVTQQIAEDNGVADQLIAIPEKDLIAVPIIGNETRTGDYLEREAKQRARLNKGEINQGEFTKWQIENRGKKTQKPLPELKEELTEAKELLEANKIKGEDTAAAQARVNSLEQAVKASSPNEPVQQDKVIKSDAEPVQKEFDVAAAILEGKTVDQIADMAIAGEIVLSPQATKEIAIKLQQANVNQVSDLSKLAREDQALALSVLAATVAPNRANAFIQEARNVMETGVRSVSAKDQANDEIRRGTLGNSIRNTNIRLQELSNARIDKAIGISEELIQNVRDTFTDSLNKETADAFMDGGTLNKMWVRRQQFPKGSEPRALIDQAINAAVSQIAASYAAEEKGGVWETLASFTRGDAEDNASATDQFLNRVIISNGKVFYTTEPTVDPATGKIDRALLDQNFDLSDLKNKSPQVYTLLKRAAENNTKQLLAANG